EELDSLGLLYLEQPLADDDLVGHADLDDNLATPICLDESITSVGVLESALALRACSVVSVKAARLGGYRAAVRAHDRGGDEGLGLRCGGLIATGVGRGADLALGRLPLFSLPGDLSAGDRFFAEDVVVAPIRLGAGGMIDPPQGPGIGVEVRSDLDRWATGRAWIPGRAG
ncbi:MAG: enolase C-terminal domain-like protein, partial [Acidimicrobiales bacterium]